jgi:hypothetical protein
MSDKDFSLQTKTRSGTLPKFKIRETPIDCIIGECEAYIGVSAGGQ